MFCRRHQPLRRFEVHHRQSYCGQGGTPSPYANKDIRFAVKTKAGTMKGLTLLQPCDLNNTAARCLLFYYYDSF
jgi:hypothetical protein